MNPSIKNFLAALLCVACVLSACQAPEEESFPESVADNIQARIEATFAGFVKETGKGVVGLTNSSEGIQDIGLRLLDPDAELLEVRSKSEAITVSEEILDRYTGKYELTPDFQLTITRDGTQLYVQGTGQPKHELFAESKRKFFHKLVCFPVTPRCAYSIPAQAR